MVCNLTATYCVCRDSWHGCILVLGPLYFGTYRANAKIFVFWLLKMAVTRLGFHVVLSRLVVCLTSLYICMMKIRSITVTFWSYSHFKILIKFYTWSISLKIVSLECDMYHMQLNSIYIVLRIVITIRIACVWIVVLTSSMW